MRIVRLDKAGAERWRAEIEAIFWANAGTKTFSSGGDREAYRELWLGRYLRHMPEACFIALESPAPSSLRHPGSPQGYPGSHEMIQHETPDSSFAASGVTEIVGYLAGSFISNRDPLPGPDYYEEFPPALTGAMPAHIHVNIREDVRGQRIGSALVAVFRALCRERGIPGLHAVTAADSRAARFFARCGLREQAAAEWRGRRLVFLGERL